MIPFSVGGRWIFFHQSVGLVSFGVEFLKVRATWYQLPGELGIIEIGTKRNRVATNQVTIVFAVLGEFGSRNYFGGAIVEFGVLRRLER